MAVGTNRIVTTANGEDVLLQMEELPHSRTITVSESQFNQIRYETEMIAVPPRNNATQTIVTKVSPSKSDYIQRHMNQPSNLQHNQLQQNIRIPQKKQTRRIRKPNLKFETPDDPVKNIRLHKIKANLGRNSRRKQTFAQGQDRIDGEGQQHHHHMGNGATVVAIHNDNLTLSSHEISEERELTDSKFNTIDSKNQVQTALVDETGQSSVVVQAGIHLDGPDIDSVQFSTNVEEQEPADPEMVMFKVFVLDL